LLWDRYLKQTHQEGELGRCTSAWYCNFSTSASFSGGTTIAAAAASHLTPLAMETTGGVLDLQLSCFGATNTKLKATILPETALAHLNLVVL
jgi:hypothetical protein